MLPVDSYVQTKSMKVVSVSDIGLVRKKNQDALLTLKNKHGDFLVMVCDGIGGNKAGEVASRLVIEHFEEVFDTCDKFEAKEDVFSFLNNEFNTINDKIFTLSTNVDAYEGMGTTVTGFLFTEACNVCFNVGDSRCYGLKSTKLIQLTEDDSLVNEMLKMGEITYEESLVHPKRHYLTSAIGIWKEVEVKLNTVEDMNYYLACSDGLHSYVEDKDIASTLRSKKLSLEEKSDKLLKLALAKGGYDNITLVIVENEPED